MKIKLDIDATPQELRSFFGMPDLQPLQAEWLKDMSEKMKTSGIPFDPAAPMRAFETMQKMFWQQLGQAGTNDSQDQRPGESKAE